MLGVVISFIILSVLIAIYLSAAKNHQSQIALMQLTHNEIKVINIFKEQLEKATKITCNQHDIMIESNNFKGVVLLKNMENLNELYVSDETRFKVNQVLIISDGIHTENFKVVDTSIINHMQYLQASQPLSYLFKEQAEIGQLAMNHYYINPKTSSLSVEDIAGYRHSLVSHVSNLEIKKLPDSVKVSVTVNIPPYIKTWIALLPIKNMDCFTLQKPQGSQ